MAVSIVTHSAIDWSAVATFIGATAAIAALWYHAQTIRDGVRPVVWVEAAVLEPNSRMTLLIRNAGVGPALNVEISLWLLIVDEDPSIREQRRLALEQWPSIRRREPDAVCGRPIGPRSLAVFRTDPVSAPAGPLLALYRFDAVDVHGRTHTGIRTRQPVWRHLWWRKKSPGTAVVTRRSRNARASGDSSAPTGSGAFDRAVVSPGVNAAVWQGGTIADLKSVVTGSGATSATVYINGAPVTLEPLAGPDKSQAFESAFPGGVIPAGTIILVDRGGVQRATRRT